MPDQAARAGPTAPANRLKIGAGGHVTGVRRLRSPAGGPPAPILVTLAVAVGLAGLWLAAPPMGTDLSAQVARADFFAAHGWAPIDFRWYGGVQPLGYSLVSPPLMAWFGPRPVGAAAAVVGAVAFAALLRRTGAPRPLLGGVLGAACLVGNLVSGRITFAVGVTIGLLALLPAAALIMGLAGRVPGGSGRKVHDQPDGAGERGAGSRWGRALRYAGVAGLAALAAAASPVAGLFVGLAGAAIALAGAHRPVPGTSPVPGIRPARRSGPARLPSYTEGGPSRAPACPRSAYEGGSWRVGAALAVGAAIPLAGMAGWFGSGGWMNMSRSDLVHAAVASLAVAAVVPHRVVRIGALLSAAGVLAAYLVPTPVGLNATRLVTMFALPVVAGYAALPGWLRTPARLPGWLWPLARFVGWLRGAVPRWTGTVRPAVWLGVVLVLLAWWQPPVLDQDLARIGHPTASAGHFAPLRAELARRAPAARVEVVPTVDYGESAYLGDTLLARGWLRQVDLARNPRFFDGTLDAGSYRRWLSGHGVSYVALSEEEVSWVGRAEAELIRRGLPYLTPVWQSPGWTLYEVDGATSVVGGPAVPGSGSAGTVTVAASAPGEILVRVRWMRWLAVAGPGSACLAPAAGGWTVVRVTEPGQYRVSGSITATGPRC